MPVESLVVPADVNHPGYASALRTQLQWQTTNAANERKRFQIIMEDWTIAYNLIAASCTKHAPQLKQIPGHAPTPHHRPQGETEDGGGETERQGGGETDDREAQPAMRSPCISEPRTFRAHAQSPMNSKPVIGAP